MRLVDVIQILLGLVGVISAFHVKVNVLYKLDNLEFDSVSSEDRFRSAEKWFKTNTIIIMLLLIGMSMYSFKTKVSLKYNWVPALSITITIIYQTIMTQFVKYSNVYIERFEKKYDNQEFIETGKGIEMGIILLSWMLYGTGKLSLVIIIRYLIIILCIITLKASQCQNICGLLHLHEVQNLCIKTADAIEYNIKSGRCKESKDYLKSYPEGGECVLINTSAIISIKKTLDPRCLLIANNRYYVKQKKTEGGKR